MSPAPSRTVPSTWHRQRFDFRARIALLVSVTALGLTGCGSASEDQDRPAPATSVSSTAAASSSASPAATAAAGSPLGAGELIVFDQLLAGEESRDLYAVDPSGGEPTLVRPGE